MSSSSSSPNKNSNSKNNKHHDPHAKDPLPPGWSRGFSQSQQRHFYVHAATKHTQWHFPTASEAHDPKKAAKRAAMNKQQQNSSDNKDNTAIKAATAAPSKRQPQDSAITQQNVKRSKSTSTSSSSGSATSAAAASSSKPKSGSSSSSGSAAAAAAAATSTTADDDFLALTDQTSVAIIVPYRDLHAAQKRASHLRQFVPHMMSFLSKLRRDGLVRDYHVYIIEQSDDGNKFNRGKLLNIGFDLARKKKPPHDVFIFHDVDLLPQPDLGSWYSRFPKTPIHIARVWNRYSNNPKYFGGVVSFSGSDYKRINGYPNNFFGWGGEDDEMQRRLERLGIQFESPPSGTLVDLEQMTLTEKLDFLRANKSWKCMVKWELANEHESTWKTNGLADLKYSLLGTVDLHESKKATKYTVDIKLNGNHWTNEKAGVDFVG